MPDTKTSLSIAKTIGIIVIAVYMKTAEIPKNFWKLVTLNHCFIPLFKPNFHIFANIYIIYVCRIRRDY